MAKIHEEIVVIKLSKLVKDDAAPAEIATEEMLSALATAFQELAGEHIVVELERAYWPSPLSHYYPVQLMVHHRVTMTDLVKILLAIRKKQPITIVAAAVFKPYVGYI